MTQKPTIIDNFHGKFAFLSNFTNSEITYKNKTYPTVEHAFQAAKCVNESDKEEIRIQPTPGKAKRLGRRVKMKATWNEERISVMKELLILKFQNPALRKALLDTGNATLIEGNTWNDTFWGMCNGIGENHLGKLLMEIRTEIQNGVL